MARTINVKTTTKINRSIKAISPVIATLLMIAIAVVASLVAYAWITGFTGSTTETTGKAIQIQSATSSSGSNLIVYVQNVGQGLVRLKPDGSVYVNSVLKNIIQTPKGTATDGQPITIPEGKTAELVIDYILGINEQVKIKVVTMEGTFMEAGSSSVSTSFVGATTYTLTVNPSVGNGQVTKSPDAAKYAGGSAVLVTALPDAGWSLQSWGGDLTGSTNPSVVSMDANKAVTATFSQDQYTVNIVASPAGKGTVAKSPDALTYVYNTVLTLTATDTQPGWKFAGWVSDTVDITITGGDLAAGATARIRGPGTIRAVFSQTPYAVTFSATGLDSSATGPVFTVNGQSITAEQLRVQPYTVTINSGDQVTYSYQNTVSGGANERFQFDSKTGPDSPITILDQTFVTVNYKTEWLVNFRQTGLTSDAPNTILTVGTEQYLIDALPVNGKWVPDGTTYSFTNPINVNSGKYYWLKPTSDLLTNPIQTYGTAHAQYQAKYYLTVNTVHGTPAPGSGWYDGGTSITASINTPADEVGGTRFRCTGGSGSGSVVASITGTSTSFVIDQASSITWNWQVQYQISFAVSGTGSTNPSSPTWYDGGIVGQGPIVASPTSTFQSWTANPPSSVTFAAQSASTTITANAPGTITATFAGDARQATQITWDTFPDSVEYGHDLSIYGWLTTSGGSGIGGKTITLTFTKPDLTTFTQTLTTSGGAWSGFFSGDFAETTMLSPPNWKIVASFAGDPTYKPSTSSNREFTVTKANPSLSCSVNHDNRDFGESITTSGTLTSSGNPLSGQTITLTYSIGTTVHATRTVTTSGSGGYTDTYTPDAVGDWTVTASFTGNTNYNSATTHAHFTVSKANPNLSCSVNPSPVRRGNIVTTTGALTSNGNPISSQTITLTYTRSGTTVTHTQTTNSLGVYSDQYTTSNPTGEWTVTVSFAGNTNYNSATNHAHFTVNNN
jgi:flagellin-like protein